MKILPALITCSLEETRNAILKQVIDNINKEFPKEIKNNLVVFDNASTYQETLDLLDTNFQNIYQSNRNIGFWSAIDWLVHSFDKQYDYIYLIESDCIHYNMNKFDLCEDILDNNKDIGQIRTQEFIVEQKHLYDKLNPQSDSRRYAWQRLYNSISNSPVNFEQIDNYFYKTNFVPVLPAVNRIWAMQKTLSKLKSYATFSEFDFQKEHWKLFQTNAIFNGGFFHAREAHAPDSKILFGYKVNSMPNNIGYRSTVNDFIEQTGSYSVKKL